MISPLKGPDYTTWKVQCRMALNNDGVWEIVSGPKQAPADDANARVLRPRMECYARKQDKALATIALSVDPSLLYRQFTMQRLLESW